MPLRHDPGVLRTRGTSAAPAASPVRTLRRCRFAPTASCAGKNLNCRLCSGHASTQFRHRWHSGWCHGAPPAGSSPPWHRSRHRFQSFQFFGFFTNPRTVFWKQPGLARWSGRLFGGVVNFQAPNLHARRIQRYQRDDHDPQHRNRRRYRIGVGNQQCQQRRRIRGGRNIHRA